MKSRSLKVKKPLSFLMLLLNSVMIAAIVLLFFSYLKDNQQNMYNQNLRDIGNLNRSTAQIASELSSSLLRKMSNILHYSSVNRLTTQEFMRYTDDSNADVNAYFELIDSNYVGFALKRDEAGTYPAVNYTSSDYQVIQQLFTEDNTREDTTLTMEITDQLSGSRCFGRCATVTLWDEGVAKKYVLLLLYRSSSFTQHISLDGGFEGMSSVLINQDGSYVLRNTDFKSETFFRYLYVYNGFTLDQLEDMKAQIHSDDGNSLHHRNSIGKECVFVYSPVPNTDWICVSSVPIASFHNIDTDFRFTGLLILLLICLTATDIGYLVHLNRRLKVSTHDALAANEAKTDFLARMSHDIRTPINVISGMTELALLENNPKRTVDYLKNIHSSGKFLLGLVNDILDMNKVESGKMELHPRPYTQKEFAIYLDAVIRPLCEEKNIDFQLRSNIRNQAFMVDSLRLNQIFFNLLSNAVKFTPEGGHISLVCNATPFSDHRWVLDFSVQDDGAGMSEAFQKTMFTPFTQETRTAQLNATGTGLGLAIVHRLVELMGGSIRVESAVGKGTTFFIHMELDIVKETDATISNASVESDLAGKRILLCEDHPLNAKIVVRLLEQKQAKVTVAENGQLGVDQFTASAPDTYQAILMDVRMPIKNGIEAAREIRALPGRSDAARIPIIALTANAYDSDIQACLDAGMNAHLAKPIESSVLYRTLATMIAAKEKA
ncbi:MAG: ATP-binding protein [Eubacteriales bacterium]|nr:ATP-binding protein [Eubacteriales bacterium]